MNRAASLSSRGAPLAQRARSPRRAGAGSTLIVLFVGIAIGVGLAAAVAFYVMRTGNPYQSAVAAGVREPAKDATKAAHPATTADKPRFDFYKILPGAEEPKAGARANERPGVERNTAVTAPAIERAAITERAPAKPDERVAVAAVERPEAAPRAPKSAERVWLQAGSFATEGDAENLKAQLAMAGIEAGLQQATLPDKGVRYRVRLGPYDNADEVNRVRNDLAKRGFETTVIR